MFNTCANYLLMQKDILCVKNYNRARVRVCEYFKTTVYKTFSQQYMMIIALFFHLFQRSHCISRQTVLTVFAAAL